MQTGTMSADQANIVNTALDLLDEAGLDALTLSRLAARLQVDGALLHSWFRDERGLREEMAEALLLAQGATGLGVGESWRDWLARRARQRGRILLSRRDGARLVAAARPGMAVRQLLDADLAILVDCGFTPAQALRLILAVDDYVNGFVLTEQSKHSARADDSSSPAARRHELTGLFVDTPVLAVAICQVGDPRDAQGFEHGLRLLLDGVDATWKPDAADLVGFSMSAPA